MPFDWSGSFLSNVGIQTQHSCFWALSKGLGLCQCDSLQQKVSWAWLGGIQFLLKRREDLKLHFHTGQSPAGGLEVSKFDFFSKIIPLLYPLLGTAWQYGFHYFPHSQYRRLLA